MHLRDLWPLAAETAKEPTSRRVGVLTDFLSHVTFGKVDSNKPQVPSDRTCGFFVAPFAQQSGMQGRLRSFDKMSTTEMTKPSHDRAQASPSPKRDDEATEFSTLSVHAGEARQKPGDSITDPIFCASTYTFSDTQSVIDYIEQDQQ